MIEPNAISVVICAYTEERWGDLMTAIASVRRQTVSPREIILVVDHNDALLARAGAHFDDVQIVPNDGHRGLSDARNAGIAVACGEIVAFLDDDAAADPAWLGRLAEAYDDGVAGVGGTVAPLWDNGRPPWFPHAFDWVVGCSYEGLPETRQPVRNMIGANMSLRVTAIRAAAGFNPIIGRVSAGASESNDEGRLRSRRQRLRRRAGVPRTQLLCSECEETELCLRIAEILQDARILFEPAARVTHRVPAARRTFKYFARRCYSEGVAKGFLATVIGGQPLATERAYVVRVLPRSFLRGVRDGLSGDSGGFLRAAAIVAGFIATAAGYLAGRIRTRRAGSEGARSTAVVPGVQSAAKLPPLARQRSRTSSTS